MSARGTSCSPPSERERDLKEPSFSTVTEPSGGEPPTRAAMDDEVSSTSSSSLSIENVSNLRRDVDVVLNTGGVGKGVANGIGFGAGAGVGANGNNAYVNNGTFGDDSMVFHSRPGSRNAQRDVTAKHKSLGSMPRTEYLGGAETASLPQRRVVGGPRHRSLMRRERSKDNFGRTAPSFLDSLAERVRSVSPSPASLSSDPAKIIAENSSSGLRAGDKKSFSLGSHGRSRATSAFSVDGAKRGLSGTTGPNESFTLSPSGSRSSGLDIGDGRRTPRSQQLSSTSLRRVLSLGRPRLDSDAYSAVSEPIVYADSAHVADDIWIAPKELFEVERRVAAGVERRARDKEAVAARDRQVEALNRARAVNTVAPERAEFSLQGARREAEIGLGNGVVNMEIDSGPGAAAAAADRAGAIVEEMEVSSTPKDPAEFTNADTSSRLLRLFFSSGSSNPVPPSTAKRAEEKRLNSRSGSSRRLLFRKMSDRGRSRSHLSLGASASHRNLGLGAHAQMKSDMGSGAVGGGMGGATSGGPPGPESMSHDFDLKGRMRGIARLANIRRWLRSRAYRKHQRNPRRHPREAVV